MEFQATAPQYAGWDAPTVANLWKILDNHPAMLRYAVKIGMPILAGSDAGGFGVRHGDGLLEELKLLRGAGMGEAQVLAAATSVPRRIFGLPGGMIQAGAPAEFIGKVVDEVNSSIKSPVNNLGFQQIGLDSKLYQIQ